MKILMVGLDLNPPWTEGIRNTVKLTSQNLIKSGHEVYILTKGFNGQPVIESTEGMKYYTIPIGYSDSPLDGVFKFLTRLPVYLSRVVRREKIDIVHGHSVYPILGLIIGMTSRIVGVKSTFTLYSSPNNKKIVTGYPIFINTCLKLSKANFLTKALQTFLDSIIVISGYTYQDLLRIGINKNKIKHVNVGIDTSAFKPLNISSDRLNQIKTNLGIPGEKKVVFFAGDMAPWKGLDIFIKSITELNKKRSDIVGLVAEKSMFECKQKRMSQISNLIKQNCAEKLIYFTGRHARISELYGISDVVVYPYLSFFSLMDTPLSLLEAMAMGKPIIATNIGGFSQLIEHKKNGILVEPNDSKELVNSILYMIENAEDAKRMGFEASRLIEQKFKVDIMVDKIEKIYKELVEGN